MKKITVTGHTGKEPEVRYAPNGDAFTTFSLAVSSGSSDNKKTDWFEISCNGKNAETANKYVRKGTRLLIEGTPAVNAWVNREGKPMGVIRIFVTYLELIGAKPQEDEEPTSDDAPASGAPEDIPF